MGTEGEAWRDVIGVEGDAAVGLAALDPRDAEADEAGHVITLVPQAQHGRATSIGARPSMPAIRSLISMTSPAQAGGPGRAVGVDLGCAGLRDWQAEIDDPFAGGFGGLQRHRMVGPSGIENGVPSGSRPSAAAQGDLARGQQRRY